jgi:predicted transcriptional regulator
MMHKLSFARCSLYINNVYILWYNRYVGTLPAVEVNVHRLKELRTLRALTLRELGQQSGVSYATIWRLENGHKEARPSTIRKLARALGVDTAELVTAYKGEDA